MNGETDKCQKPSVLYHVICNCVFRHPPSLLCCAPSARPLLRSPATSSEPACPRPPPAACSLQPAARVGALLLLSEKYDQ